MSRLSENLQPALFDSASRATVCVPDGIPEDVCWMFLDLARKVKARGFDRYSADALLHQIRWYHHIEKGDQEFAVNNNWSSGLARWAMKTDKALQGFFETRNKNGD